MTIFTRCGEVSRARFVDRRRRPTRPGDIELIEEGKITSYDDVCQIINIYYRVCPADLRGFTNDEYDCTPTCSAADGWHEIRTPRTLHMHNIAQ